MKLSNLNRTFNFENTHENHFTWLYNDKPLQERSSHHDVFSFTCGTVKRPPRSFSEEMEIVLDLVFRKNSNSKIAVAFSGGRDSEYLVRKLHKMKMDFTPVFWRFEGGYNDHDFYYAKKCCTELGLPLKVYNTNTDEFFFGEKPFLFDYAIENKAHGISLAWYMWNYQNTEADVILMADGILTLQKGITFCDDNSMLLDLPVELINAAKDIRYTWQPNKWFLRQKERLWSLKMFAYRNQINLVTDIFMYTPEVMLSQLNSYEFQHCFETQVDSKGALYHLTQKEFPNIELRPKYTGMEHPRIAQALEDWRPLVYRELGFDTYVWTDLQDLYNRLTSGKEMQMIYHHQEYIDYYTHGKPLGDHC